MDKASGLQQGFGCGVEEAVVADWKKMNAKTRVIHQAELLPILVAMVTWQEVMAGRRIIVFVDNDAARSAVIKGSTASPASAKIVTAIWEMAVRSEMQLWIDRVPTSSNIADGPSRSQWASAIKLGVTKVTPRALRIVQWG